MKASILSSMSMSMALMPLSLLMITTTQIPPAAAQAFDTGSVIEMNAECYAKLKASDSDNDNQISPTEYTTYVQNESSGRISHQTYTHLPLELIQAYTFLTCNYNCFMGVGDSESCKEVCKESIPIAGADQGGNVSDQERAFLYEVCHRTKDAIYLALEMERPTEIPTPSPNPPDNVRNVEIPFGIANVKGFGANEVMDDMDLIQTAFDRLWEKVLTNLNVERLGPVRLRRLEVSSTENWLDTIQDEEECPPTIVAELVASNDIVNTAQIKCQKIVGIFTIQVTGDDNIETTAQNVAEKAEFFIQDGTFQGYLPETEGVSSSVNVNANAITNAQEDYLLYSLDSSNSPAQSTFPLFAIVGVTAGAVLIGLFAGRALVVNRRRRGSQLPDSDDEEYHSDDLEKGMGHMSGSGLIAGNGDGESMGVGTYGDVERISIDDSSNAGSSGWSSSAGVSSMNTGSVDSVEYFSSSLAAIGAASNVHKKYEGPKKDNMYPIEGEDENSQSDGSEHKSESEFARNVQPLSKDDLEKQIEAGDWAAVGATAAILASDHRSSASSLSSGLSSQSSMSSTGLSSALSGTSRERARAAELDRLVDAGDWEGVVLTAAKFEAESDRDDKTEESASVKDYSRGATDRSFANSSAASPSVSTNISDTLSSNRKRAEMRAEVESLVRRVVPDEIENIDEMMSQFLGREEELVETLRTMQERSIAARQREASRRNAKREAKKLAKEAKKASAKKSPVRVANAESKPLVGSSSEQADLKSIPSKGENSSAMSSGRVALESAIEAGDWEAVGRTAEQLGTDGSVNSAYESANDTDSDAYLSSHSRPDSERAAELTGLIDQKDWSGVVAAASNYTRTDDNSTGNQSQSQDDQQRSKSSGSSGGRWKMPFSSKKSRDAESDDGTEDASQKQTIAKEEEARAQAQIWSKIAEQSKVKGANAGASDAADWAISRSYKQIQDSSINKNQTETRSVASSNDDNSV